MIRIGQHFGDLQLARFRQPAMENFQEKITLEIDEDRLGVFVATFRAAAPQRLFARANVDIARPVLFRAQAFDGQNQIARNAGVIARRPVLRTSTVQERRCTITRPQRNRGMCGARPK